MCCQSALSRASQIALTLRTVSGWSTLELHERSSSRSQHDSPHHACKQAIKDSGVPFRMPAGVRV
jgi:predicted RNA polymerase sigma factor